MRCFRSRTLPSWSRTACTRTSTCRRPNGRSDDGEEAATPCRACGEQGAARCCERSVTEGAPEVAAVFVVEVGPGLDGVGREAHDDFALGFEARPRRLVFRLGRAVLGEGAQVLDHLVGELFL